MTTTRGLKPRDMFDVKPVKMPLPEGARGFENCVCAECGEEFAECYAHPRGRQDTLPRLLQAVYALRRVRALCTGVL